MGSLGLVELVELVEAAGACGGCISGVTFGTEEAPRHVEGREINKWIGLGGT